MKIVEAHPNKGCASSVYLHFTLALLQDAVAAQRVDNKTIHNRFSVAFHIFAPLHTSFTGLKNDNTMMQKHIQHRFIHSHHDDCI